MSYKIINRKGMSILGMVISGLLAVLFIVMSGCDNEPDTGINYTFDEIISEQNAVSSILDTDEDSTYYLTVWCNKTEVKQGESVRVTAWCLYGPGPTNGEPVINAKVRCYIWKLGEAFAYIGDSIKTDEGGFAHWNVFIDPEDFKPGYYSINLLGKLAVWGDIGCYEWEYLRVNSDTGWVSDCYNWEDDRSINALHEKEKGKIKKLPEMK